MQDVTHIHVETALYWRHRSLRPHPRDSRSLAMSWQPFSRRASDGNIDALPIPWDAGRPSIYDHILQHIEPGRDRLREGGETLPDEEIHSEGEQIGFAPGAFDGVFGHHVSDFADQEASDDDEDPHVEEVFAALERAM